MPEHAPISPPSPLVPRRFRPAIMPLCIPSVSCLLGPLFPYLEPRVVRDLGGRRAGRELRDKTEPEALKAKLIEPRLHLVA